MGKPYRIAVAGLGVVGTSLIRIYNAVRENLDQGAGRPIEIVGVSARRRNVNRGFSTDSFLFWDSAVQMAKEADVDCVVELIGGDSGVALECAEATLARGLDFVTANKALLAVRGTELAKKAAATHASLSCEAAVAGGIPVIKCLREGLVSNRIRFVRGILNGTANFILTEMEKTSRSYEEVLSQAQERGYAEQDPSFDVDGVDAAHKLAILAGLAFHTPIRFSDVDYRGIRGLSVTDIAAVRDLGYHVRLVGHAEEISLDGNIGNLSAPALLTLWVRPVLVPEKDPLSHVLGARNALQMEGDWAGSTVLEGWGAGGDPTASSVWADLVDLARGRGMPLYTKSLTKLRDCSVIGFDRWEGRFFLSFEVRDESGIMAGIAGALASQGVSIALLQQQVTKQDAPARLLLMTHVTAKKKVDQSLESMRGEPWLLAEPTKMMILDD